MNETKAYPIWAYSAGESSPSVLSLTKFVILTLFTFKMIVLEFTFPFEFNNLILCSLSERGASDVP